MRKAARKAKERAGQLVDKLRPASRSQLLASSEVGPRPARPTSPASHTTVEPILQSPETVVMQSPALPQSLETVGVSASTAADLGTVTPAPPTGRLDYDNPQAQLGQSEPSDLVAHEVSEVARLPLNLSLGQIPIILNNNQNTTYNFGRDVINNNWITNNIYLTKAEEDVMKIIKFAIGNRFVPAALHETQSDEAGCMPGTRVRVLSMFMEWAKHDPMRIFWLAGLAGTGKTSIAVTLCRMLQEEPNILLGGAFFCSRTSNIAELIEARCILPTLVVSLAEQSSTFSGALAKELNADSRVALKPISAQIDALLQRPLITLASLTRPIIFVIDALDECSDEREVKKLLQAISTLRSDVTVKFILTSRPETHISASPISNSDYNSILRLHMIDSGEVTEDIFLYIDDAFTKSPLAKPWYSAVDVKMLAALSDGLFIFASTVISYLLKVQSVKGRMTRLRTVLSAVQDSKVALGPLDAMYELVLTRASDTAEIEPKELEETLKVLACILAARVPLSVGALADLLELEIDELRESLGRLHAVVHVPELGDQPGLRTVHASFGDYLFARLRISTSQGDETLTHSCLRVMHERLCFNVSNSRSSYEQNPVSKPNCISLSLEYACMQWIYHIAGLTEPSTLDNEIDKRFRARLLFWLEVMSVLGRVSRAAAMLLLAASTVQLAELSQFFRDAHAFVASSREAIRRSAPHIYLSALPFSAKDSLVYRTFIPLTTGIIFVDTFGIDRHGGRLVMTLTGHKGYVNSVAYSSDGRFIASGSGDGTVRIWDPRSNEEMTTLASGDSSVGSVSFARDGRSLAIGTSTGNVCIWKLLAGLWTPQRHLGQSESHGVTCVTCSPDGTLVALASQDKMVRLWRAEKDGQVILLEGHEDNVETVAFSTSGDILASGCRDKTIRLWCSATGEPIGQPLTGHTDWIRSVSFSPAGEQLVSGADDQEIRLWKVQTGTCIATLRGHSSWIHSVVFSPNGHVLASAADDQSVRLWNLRQDPGETSSIVLEGHSGPVHSVAFSPDSLYIASASEDCTIRIWDAGSDKTAVKPLQTHDGRVNSVVASPDGDLIVTGSDRNSVCVWEARTGELKLPPLLGHTKSVNSVAISTDGRLIASASDDRTIRFWDTQTGESIGAPLQGHEKQVNGIQFSPDSRWLVSGSDDKTTRLWDVSGRHQSVISPLRCDGAVFAVTISPDGQLIAAGDRTGRVHIWSIATGQTAHDPFHANDKSIRSIAFSPDGTHIVCGGSEEVGRVWNIGTGEQILTLDSNDWLRSIAFSPNGQIIGTASNDRTVCLWDAATGERLAILQGHGSYVKSVAFTWDGNSIVSGSSDSTIRVWDVNVARSQSSNRGKDPIVALDSTRLEDGWLLGQSRELLLWVPADYRDYLKLPSCKILIAKHNVSITTEAILHRGENWTACWRGAAV